MSYASVLDDIFGKRPIWLYEFAKDGEQRFFTSRSSDWTDPDSQVWSSRAISHTAIRNTGVMGRASVDIVFPQSDEWARTYIEDNGYEDNTVQISRVFLNDGALEKSLRFRGRVIYAKPGFTRLILTAENRFTELRRKGINAVFQRPCRHSLYHSQAGYGCGVNIASFRVAGTVTAISLNTLTISAASSYAAGYFSGGVFEWNGKRQFIVSHSGSTIVLLGPVPGFAAAQAGGNQAVTIAPGCDLSRATCASRFNNLANFGGFSWADETPFDGKTVF
jgi:uncharacterized phage protein (TIGR02218 family)